MPPSLGCESRTLFGSPFNLVSLGAYFGTLCRLK